MPRVHQLAGAGLQAPRASQTPVDWRGWGSMAGGLTVALLLTVLLWLDLDALAGHVPAAPALHQRVPGGEASGVLVLGLGLWLFLILLFAPLRGRRSHG